MTILVIDQGDIATLLERTRRGSPDALATLYERYAAGAYRVAYGLTRSRADAEDVVQDLFVGLPRALATLRDIHSIEGWLRRITVRMVLMRMRSGKRRREESFDERIERPGSHGHFATVERIAVDRALGALPEPLRVVFVLKVIEGYAHNEIADLLGITVADSRVRLFRARSQLQKLLS